MCNMAAYAGGELAAPVLLRMLEAQEGIGGGHYSGIATLHEGKIHLAKVCGACCRLRQETVAESLPGTVGIAHSRTPGIPLSSWAQPFLATGGEVAYCANGSAGRFGAGLEVQDIYDLLRQAGAVFPSEVDYAVPPYPVLRDGHSLHSTELFSQFLAWHHAQGEELMAALRRAFSRWPSEIAGLALSVREPGRVTAIRLNQPLMWGRQEGAFYLATSALAFAGEKLNWVNPVPAGCSLSLTAAGISLLPLDSFNGLLDPVTPAAAGAGSLDGLLADGLGHDIGELVKAVRGHWGGDKLAPAAMVAYEYLREKISRGEVIQELGWAPATRPGDQAPHARFRRSAGQAG